MTMFRILMLVLAVLQVAFTVFTALVGSFADAGSLGERAVLVLVHPLAAIGLLVLVTQPQLSIKGVRVVAALLAVNVAADVALALLIAGGAVKGDWELPLVFAVIPAIGVVYAVKRMTSRASARG
ncbi:MAG: hypothetical protein F4185_07065 [Chloroflexi bacterium]|nr:hypothetical protein [Chloroflexota bacterium]MYF65623.1 hypothetical protein [Chloroflexota bacterium]MYK33862.1 hypothetical protein [Chloroflexota bacterium]